MKKQELNITLNTIELTEELSQLIKLLKEADALIDSISSKRAKNLIAIQHTPQ